MALIAVIAVAQAAWLFWCLREPLPNASNVGEGLKPQRWMFLTRAVPHLMVEGLTFAESHLGLTWDKLRHVENLPQRLPIVLAAGLIGGAAVALGGLALRVLRLDRALAWYERLPIAYAVGAALLGVLTLVAGRLGLLNPWSTRLALIGLIGAGITAGWVERRNAPAEPRSPLARSFPWRGVLAMAAVAGPFLTLMALGAMLPTIDFDAIEYHLQGPKEYYQNGRITFLSHNVYTSMPFGVEMLHLLGMEILDDWWLGALAGQLLIAAHAPAAATLIGLTASRWGSPRAGWFAAAVYLTTPWIYRLGVLPYVEGPLCDYHAALFYASARAWTEIDAAVRRRFWALAGLLAGGAMACKYPALVSAVLPFGLVAAWDGVRRRSLSSVVAFSLGWAVVTTPWLGKNVIDTGNPVYPLGHSVFGGRHWDAELDAKWSNGHGRKPIQADLLWENLVDVAGRSDWQSPLYLALAPLAFLRPASRKLALALASYAAYLFLTWWTLTHRLDRFWLPLLPACATLAGLGADWTRRRAWSAVLGLTFTITVVTNLSYSGTALVGLNEWTTDLAELRRTVPAMCNAPLARLDDALPPGAKVLLVGQAAVFHMERPLIYNVVFNHETFETIARGRTPEEVRMALLERGVDYVYVDWFDIERYRSPGNYGFTDWVRPDEFDRLVKAGVLEGPTAIGARQDVYRVRSRP
ncbi:MAG: hypothetical protein AB7I30_13475 [Isosphaeraceae bacterium]